MQEDGEEIVREEGEMRAELLMKYGPYEYAPLTTVRNWQLRRTQERSYAESVATNMIAPFNGVSRTLCDEARVAKLIW